MYRKKLPTLLFFICLFVVLLTGCQNPVEVAVKSILVEDYPRYEFYLNEDFSAFNATILVSYSDDTTERKLLNKNMIKFFDTSKVGKSKIVVSYEGAEDTIAIEVLDLVLENIEVTKQPTLIEVTEGKDLNLSELELTALYFGGKKVVISLTKEMIAGFDKNKIGNQKVTIEYGNATTSFDIVVIQKTIDSIAVVNSPEKLTYFINDEFIPDGLSIRVSYNNGTYENVVYSEETKLSFDFQFDFTYQQQESLVSILYKEVALDSDFIVSVNTKKWKSMIILSYPKSKQNGNFPSRTHTNFVEGDEIDLPTGEVLVTFDDETTVKHKMDDTKNITLLGYDKNKIGTQSINISFQGNSQWVIRFDITVFEKAVADFKLYDSNHNELSTITTKYFENDIPVLDFVKYKLFFNNNTSTAFEDFVAEDHFDENNSLLITKAEALAGTKTIVFSYSGVKSSLIFSNVSSIFAKNIALKTYPTKLYYAVNETEVNISGGLLYVEFNNNVDNIKDIELKPEMIISDSIIWGRVGEYTVKINYMTKETSFRIFIIEKLASALQIMNLDEFKKEYYDSELYDNDIDWTQLIIKVDDSADTIQVSLSMIQNFDKSRTGVQTVTIHYNGARAYLNITILPRTVLKIGIERLPKTLYAVGEKLDLSGLKIKKMYSDKTVSYDEFANIIIKGYTLQSPDMNLIGEHSVKVFFDSNGEVSSTTFNIIITKPVLQSFTIVNNNGTLAFDKQGDYLLSDGGSYDVGKGQYPYFDNLYILPVYLLESGQTIVGEKIALNYAFTNYEVNNITSGNRTLLVTFGSAHANLKINVLERAITSIAVAKIPDTLTYIIGQNINLNGGILKVTFSDLKEEYISMNDVSVLATNYRKNPFLNGSTMKSMEQEITLIYKDFEILNAFTVTSYIPLSILNADLIYKNDGIFYGENSRPSVAVRSNPMFTDFIPPTNISIEFKVYISENEFVYTSEVPKKVGTYSMRITIAANTYYEAAVIEEKNYIISTRTLSLIVDDMVAIYNPNQVVTSNDISFSLDGMIVPGEESQVNQALSFALYSKNGDLLNSVKDAGEYEIRAIYDNSKLPCSNYRIGELAMATYTIRPVEIDSAKGEIFRFELPNPIDSENNVYETGNPLYVRAYYEKAGAIVYLDNRDVLYTDILGTPTYNNVPPKDPGTYKTSVSSNYVVKGSSSSIIYNIVPYYA